MTLNELFSKEKFSIRARSTVEFTHKNKPIIGITEIYLDRPLVCPHLEHGTNAKFGIVRKVITPTTVICFAVLFKGGRDITSYARVDYETFAEITHGAAIFNKHQEIVGPGNEGLPFSGVFDSPQVKWEQF